MCIKQKSFFFKLYSYNFVFYAIFFLLPGFRSMFPEVDPETDPKHCIAERQS